MDEGYIKLYRSMTKWEWYSDPNTKAVFLHLLLNANLEETRYMNHVIPKGGLVTGYPKLSEQLGISIQSVRTAFKHLKLTNEITVKSTNKFSIVTIVNWEKYQGGKTKLTGKTTDKSTVSQQSTNSQLTTEKEYKNKELKNIEKEEINKEEFPSIISADEVQALFNKTCIFFKPCSTITKTRLAKIKLLRQQFSLEEIEEVFSKANQSDFLKGKNERAWKASFDWLIDIDNFVKVKEDAFCNSIHLVEKKKNNLKQYSDYNDLDQMEREAREKARNLYHNYIHGNYDFEQMEKELKEK